jgi:hypothetical protein
VTLPAATTIAALTAKPMANSGEAEQERLAQHMPMRSVDASRQQEDRAPQYSD